MFKNHLKTAWRNITKDKGYTAFNLLGLATGMAIALIIGLWVQYQFSYDKFLPGYQQAYRVMIRTNRNGDADAGGATSLALADVLKKDVPEIKYVAQADWIGQHGLVVGDKKLYNSGIFAGEDFLKIFQYSLLRGNASEVLKQPASIVLTKATATALFGNEDPINKIVRLDNAQDVKVTGVLKDLPGNSTMQFKYILPFSFYVQTQSWIKDNMQSWSLHPIQTFVSLQQGVTTMQVEAKLAGIIKKYDADDYRSEKSILFIHPLSHWHLHSTFVNGYEAGGFIDYVRMFGIIGILVLVIACINFTNLSTVRSERRAREVGVRKAVGSLRRHIIFQFLIESVLITFMAFLVSLFFVSTVLPAFNTLTSSNVAIPWLSVSFWAIMIAYVLITGLAAGSRPAFYLSSFRPVKVLKGAMQIGKAATLPRKILVVLQFSCSVALIISTVIVYQQIQYAKNRPNGYNADRLVITDASGDIDRNYAALKNDLLQTGVIASVTKSTAPVTEIYSWTGLDNWQGKQPGESLGMATIGVTDDYFNTLGIHFLKGRNFSGWGNNYDTVDVILNEAAVKRLRFKEAINQEIFWNGGRKIKVIGVVKDALMRSPFSPPEPTFFVYNPVWSSVVMYRLSPNVNAGAAIAKVAPVFNKYNPSYPFTYHFADENYAAKFNQEVLIGRLSGIFAALAIFISCLGLFGLAAYVAQQRTKEIGIRKVLGASVPQLWALLSKDFVVLVAISCVVASPVAWYFLNGWLLQYDYRITIGPGVFIASALVAMLITALTISIQAIRAATANPVKALKVN